MNLSSGHAVAGPGPNMAVERTAHTIRFLAICSAFPVGRHSPRALGGIESGA
jgi:hypothetical protein